MTDVKLLLLHSNTWNHLTVSKNKKISGSFKDVIYKIFTNHIYLIHVHKQDLSLNNLQWLICHKAQRK